MNRENKILITVPAPSARGGITNYYQVLKHEFSSNIEYFERGARNWPTRKGVLSEIIRAWQDYKGFKKRIKKGDVSLVQTSTSLGFNSIVRDGFFIRFARKNGIKTIVFFRGWDLWAEKKTERYLWLFKFFFFKTSTIIALTEHTKKIIKNWGYKGKILLETTLVDKALINDISEEYIRKKYTPLKNSINLLYLSRVETRKGIYELIDAFKELQKAITNNSFSLQICGDGFELENIVKKIKEQELSNITISGFISGEKKIEAYKNADIFVFPSYGEGMPNAVLEAMGFGLPVITTPVGGVKDFFENDKNGYFIEIKSSMDITKKIRFLLANPNNIVTIALNNYQKANKVFRSDIVAKRIENIFENVLNNNL